MDWNRPPEPFWKFWTGDSGGPGGVFAGLLALGVMMIVAYCMSIA